MLIPILSADDGQRVAAPAGHWQAKLKSSSKQVLEVEHQEQAVLAKQLWQEFKGVQSLTLPIVNWPNTPEAKGILPPKIVQKPE